jgi:A/G-specific adenine glycosylase
LQKKKVDLLPVKSKKLKVRNRFFNYLVVSDDNENTLIQKRTAKGIWHNLYEFPLIETDGPEDFDFIAANIKDEFFKNNSVTSIEDCNEKNIIHKLSHQHLHIKFWKIRVDGTIENGIDATTLKTFPFPIVIFNFIEMN